MEHVEKMKTAYNKLLKTLSSGAVSDERLVVEGIHEMELVLEDLLVDVGALE